MNSDIQYKKRKLSRRMKYNEFTIPIRSVKLRTMEREQFSMYFNHKLFVGHCKACDLPFSSRIELEAHILAKHGMYMCAVCAKLHSSKIVDYHLFTYGNYRCDECNSGFIETLD